MYFPPSNTPEYRRGNADAHRVRPANFRAPALISHQAFWIYSNRQQHRDKERDRVKHIIDRVILQTANQANQRYDQDAYITPSIGGSDILFANIAFARRFLVNQSCQSEDGRVDPARLNPAQRTVFESDHRVVSLQFKWSGCEVTVRFEFLTEYFSITTIAEVAACTLPGMTGRIERLQNFDLDDVVSIKNELFEIFWRELTYDICPESLLADTAFAHIFADFRGVVLANDRLLAMRDNEPFIEVLLPLLGSSKSQQGYECSVSYMLGGRALYMTTLGPQLAAYADERRIPVTYLLSVSAASNRWQRGRLIDLIHTAGTGRLAALRDLAALRGAGNRLSGLDYHTSIARAAVSEHRQLAHSRHPMPDVAKCINAAHARFNEVTESFNTTAQTDYGLSYRIERSRYYVARSLANTALMRIERVEGYHRYDEFVEQRLGGTFDFIDRLGRRYERAVGALSLLDGYHLTIQSNEIALSQNEIALSQAEEEAEEAAISEKTLEIQVYGEFILIAFLLPYYAVGLLAHIYEDAGPGAHQKIKILTYIIWTVAFGSAIYRIGAQDRRWRRISRAIVLLILMWIFISASAQALGWAADKLELLSGDWWSPLIHWLVRQFPVSW
jgi:hypothetical protein